MKTATPGTVWKIQDDGTNSTKTAIGIMGSECRWGILDTDKRGVWLVAGDGSTIRVKRRALREQVETGATPDEILSKLGTVCEL